MSNVESIIGILAMPALIFSIAFMKIRARKKQTTSDFAKVNVVDDCSFSQPINRFMIQFVSIPDLNPSDLLDEAILFDHPYLRSANFSYSLCEHFIKKIENAKRLFKFFKIQESLIYENVWKLSFQDLDVLTEKYLDENYQNWISISDQDNTMDEYGSLLEIQNLLQNHSGKEIFAVLRIKNSNEMNY